MLNQRQYLRTEEAEIRKDRKAQSHLYGVCKPSTSSTLIVFYYAKITHTEPQRHRVGGTIPETGQLHYAAGQHPR